MKSSNKLLLLSLFLLTIIISCSSEENFNEEIIINANDFTIEINEFPVNGQIIGKINASTNQGKLAFSVISQTPNNAFTINSSTGELKVLNKTLFNFDENTKISGIVEVRNGDITSHSNVTINVKNVEIVFFGDLNIQTQTELDNFASNNYDKVNGSITLFGESIVNTSNLKSIKFIDGNIIIIGTNIKNIDGFSNSNISNDATIQIVNNQKLENLNGLQNITSRLMNLDIYYNPLINNIDGLKNISNVTNQINISDTEYLTNLNGLTGINNPVNFLFIRNNSALVDTNGLLNIPSISTFSFTSNNSVTSLSNMPNLKEINSFFLDSNNKLENINGLSSLEVCNNLTIQSNISLKNLDGLVKLNDGGISITGNTSLNNFCGLGLISTNNTVNFYIYDNLYNPTKDDIKNGNCSN
jgi:hypothetical protein